MVLLEIIKQRFNIWKVGNMKTYLNENKFYNYKRIKPNKVYKFKKQERDYGRQKRGKR